MDPDRDPHDQAEELLPWYATGQLDAADRALVETHLADCARCRRQLSAERQLIDEFQALTPEVDSGWSRIRNRIEAPARRSPSWAARTAGDFWQILSRPAVAALATAQLAFLAAAVAIFPSLDRPAYRGLGEPTRSSANIIVLFRPETTEAGMRETLRASGAALVGGPTDADAYLLHVSAKERPIALARLHADHDIVMAEPIDGASR